MRFRLIYKGKLYGPQKDGRAAHKHSIRKIFHPQLRRLWALNEQLQSLPANTDRGRLWVSQAVVGLAKPTVSQ